ncbi:hypothetical protein AURDEDRAFT_172450 [Auricularia subglabra TFB-10046 SS5]|nr:hypothetical protein AURDEDRAFT_172450 [Auricularia subglabra TFB-10046 SS5]
MWRVRSLEIAVRYEHQGFLHPEETDDPFPIVPTPRLEELRVISGRCFTIPAAWSGTSAPRLRSMLLQGFKLDPACQQFRSLRRFRGLLVCLPKGTFQDLRRFLVLCPVLEDIELLGASNPYLQWLPVGARHALASYVLSEVLGMINYNQICKWVGPIPRQMRLSHSTDFMSLFAFFEGHVTETFSLSCPTTGVDRHRNPQDRPIEFHTTLTSATGTSLEFDTCNRTPYVTSLRDAIPSLGLLAHLECTVEIFDNFLRLSPTLPSLETLSLVLGGERKFSDLNYCYFQNVGTLYAAGLRVLSIDTTQLPCGRAETGDLATAALTWCTRTFPRTVTAWLHFDRPRLAAVNCVVVSDSGHTLDTLSIDRLLERAEEFRIVQRQANQAVEGSEWTKSHSCHLCEYFHL